MVAMGTHCHPCPLLPHLRNSPGQRRPPSAVWGLENNRAPPTPCWKPCDALRVWGLRSATVGAEQPVRRCTGFRATESSAAPPRPAVLPGGGQRCRGVCTRDQGHYPVLLNSGLLMLESPPGIFDHPNTEPRLPHARPRASYTRHSTESAQQPCGGRVYQTREQAPAPGSAG